MSFDIVFNSIASCSVTCAEVPSSSNDQLPLTMFAVVGTGTATAEPVTHKRAKAARLLLGFMGFVPLADSVYQSVLQIP